MCSQSLVSTRRTRTLDAVRDANPDVILIAPCGFDLDRAAADAERVLSTDAWSWARDKQVWALDANSFLSRPGPRVIDGIEMLARVLHPDAVRHPSRRVCAVGVGVPVRCLTSTVLLVSLGE